MAEIVFTKMRGKDRQDNLEINLEEFIAVKGISALGNQLTKEKVLEINVMESLFYKAPEPIPIIDLEVIDEEELSKDSLLVNKTNSEEDSTNKDTPQKKKNPKSDSKEDDKDQDMNGEGQTSLF